MEKYDKKNDITLPNKKYKKAGIFIHDPKLKKILLVQSRGKRWGCPKGSVDDEETDKECAIRETWEETGIKIDINNLSDTSYTIYSRSTYFYKEMDECDIKIPSITGNDVNGFTWIKLDCLMSMVENNYIWISKDCKILIDHHKLKKNIK